MEREASFPTHGLDHGNLCLIGPHHNRMLLFVGKGGP